MRVLQARDWGYQALGVLIYEFLIFNMIQINITF